METEIILNKRYERKVPFWFLIVVKTMEANISMTTLDQNEGCTIIIHLVIQEIQIADYSNEREEGWDDSFPLDSATYWLQHVTENIFEHVEKSNMSLFRIGRHNLIKDPL